MLSGSYDHQVLLANMTITSKRFSLVTMLLVSVALIVISFPFSSQLPRNAAVGQYLTPLTPRTFSPPIVVPLDVTNTQMVNGPFSLPASQTSVFGVQSYKQFSTEMSGPSDWILVRTMPDTSFTRLSPHSVALQSGQLLVSVRRPSRIGIIETPLGEVAVAANADVLLNFSSGVLRIFNLDGRPGTIKLRLHASQTRSPIVGIAPGFELAASNHVLTRADLRPQDGFARRHSKLLQDGHLGISEFSLQSILNHSELIATLRQKNAGAQAMRVIGDMSKMAAVLNYLNGTQGYIQTTSPLRQ